MDIAQWSIAEWSSLAGVIGVAVAVVTLAKGIVEYGRQGSQKRAEYFAELRTRLKASDSFKELSALIEVDNPKLESIPFKDKRDFLGFFEEVALMRNSRLISNEVAHYMFGYYAIRCWDSRHFWSGVNRESLYWTLFREFVDEMRNVEKRFRYSRRRFRL